jgi:hypothetical protein
LILIYDYFKEKRFIWLPTGAETQLQSSQSFRPGRNHKNRLRSTSARGGKLNPACKRLPPGAETQKQSSRSFRPRRKTNERKFALDSFIATKIKISLQKTK